ncbi:MAG: polyprenyl synthetase family protein [Minisyncoccia bacterium]
MIDINLYINKQKQLVDRHLGDILSKNRGCNLSLEKLYDAMGYTILLPGKRLRPIMAIATCELFSSKIEEAINPACAIEILHSASLMLDDLPMMDDAIYRRGERTNHTVFSEPVTVLACAALWAKVFSIFSDINSIPINNIIERTARSIGDMGLVRGQFLDIESFSKTQTIDELIKNYELKTGTLFSLATYVGATLGGASVSEREALANFGTAFGVAFQFRDDIIDSEQTFAESGKDSGKDSKNKKQNIVSIAGAENAKIMLNKMIGDMCASLEDIDRDCSVLKELSQKLTIK